MKPIVVSDVLAVGEFPTMDQIEMLARAGFRSVINNQPDGEVGRFPSAAEVEGIARRHGLEYTFAPLSSRTPPGNELEKYASAIRTLPSPIYAFCYSGARSAAGCAQLLARTGDVEAIIAEFADSGFDLDSLRPWLEEANRQAPKNDAAQPAKPGVGGAAHVNGNGKAGGAPISPGRGSSSSGVQESWEADVGESRPAGMPRMVVVQPRAAGFGGFAM